MNDIATRAGTGVSADLASKLMSGIAKSRSTTPVAGGTPFLRLGRDGVWAYGQEDTEVEEGSQWVVNVLSLAHGYSCWTDYPEKNRKNELLGEIMSPMFEDKPTRPADDQGFPYKEQRSFGLKCVSGEDEGVETLHKATSVGGMRAIDGLLAAIQTQLRDNPSFPCPVIELGTDSYNHKKWGKTYVPVLEVVGWADMNGNRHSEDTGSVTAAKAVAAPAPVPHVEPEPTQRKRRTTAQETAAAEETRAAPAAAPAEPETVAAPRAGIPRRRPGQR